MGGSGALQSFETVGDVVLAGLIRLIGVLWAVGALLIARRMWTDRRLDAMIGELGRVASELEAEAREGAADPGARGRAGFGKSETEAWIDRDDRRRRAYMTSQAVVLLATGLSMALMHASAAWLAALLVGGQGVYFLWREAARRRAPTPEAAAEAAPERSTVNAAWTSLAAAGLVWIAGVRGLLWS